MQYDKTRVEVLRNNPVFLRLHLSDATNLIENGDVKTGIRMLRNIEAALQPGQGDGE